MPYYSGDLIEEVISQNDVVEVISEYVTLKKSGRNYMGLCPFHREKSPSFCVSMDKQIFKCFGCSEGGNVITFIMKIENVDFWEAIEMLSERAKELKREIAFTEERIVIIEERKRELMEEAKAYNIVDDDDTIIEDIIKGAFKMICAGGLLTTTDLKNILNHDQLENNIIQKERDLFSLTNQLSTLKSELKEIESKLEE